MTSIATAWRALDESQHRARFYSVWRTGLSAGFTLVRSLEVMGPAERDVEHRRQWLLNGARAGRDLASLVRAPGAPFSSFEAGLLALGDDAGRLEQVLGLLADYHERRHRWMLTVRKRLAYPLLTATSAIVIAPVSLLVVGHARIYAAIVVSGIAALWLGGGAIVSAAAVRFGRAPRLVRARLMRALTLAIEAGLPLGASLRLAAESCGDPAVAHHVARIGEARLATQSLHDSLAGCRVATPELLAVLGNAERTGDFTGTLVRLADLYDAGG